MTDLPPDCGALTQPQAVIAVAAAAKSMPETEFKGAAPSAIPCFAETRIGDHQAWVDKSGRYVLFGAAIDARTGKFVSDMTTEVNSK